MLPASSPDILPGAEPFFFRGGETGALLVHGFTGTPHEMWPLGEALATAGHTVLGVRLAHHGTRPLDMARSHWRDWFNAALDGYYVLLGQCQAIFVIGHSMGGVIALQLAARYPTAGVVALSAPSTLFHDRMDWRVHLAMPLSYMIPYVPKWRALRRPRPAAPPAGSTAAPEPGPYAYSTYPLRALPQLRALLRETGRLLPQVRCPALLVHSRDDATIPAENMPYLFARLGSMSKHMLWLEQSGHVITEGPERDELFAWVNDFIRAHASPADSALPSSVAGRPSFPHDPR